MNIGKGLKTLRARHKLTQKSVAASLGISQPYLSKLEQNKKEPSTALMRSIGEFYDVPFAVVLWMVTDAADVSSEKRDSFNKIRPLVVALINELL